MTHLDACFEIDSSDERVLKSKTMIVFKELKRPQQSNDMANFNGASNSSRPTKHALL